MVVDTREPCSVDLHSFFGFALDKSVNCSDKDIRAEQDRQSLLLRKSLMMTDVIRPDDDDAEEKHRIRELYLKANTREERDALLLEYVALLNKTGVNDE